MSFTTTLAKAIDASDRVIAGGYEIEEFKYVGGSSLMRLICDDDCCWYVDEDQRIEVSDEGTAEVKLAPDDDMPDDEDPGFVIIEFEVRRALQASDL